jgi:hypothetical protein
MQRRWTAVWAACVAACGCAAALAESTDEPGTTPTVRSVWLEHEIDFTYIGFTSYYSCDGLRDKLRWILDEIGARPDYRISMRGCIRQSGPEAMPGARIVASLPAEATPAVLEQLAHEAPRLELIARATGNAAAVQEATAQFPARPRRVTFRSSRTGRLQDGDCELMQQLRDDLLVPMGVKIVESDLRCVPRSVSMGSVRMTVETLEKLPEQAD